MNGVGWTVVGVAIGAFITGLFGWLGQRTKSGAEIEVAVLAEWQKLNAALAERVSMLEKQLADVRRQHADEIDEMRRQHRAEMSHLRELNEGLQRQIAQNSQSTAHMMGDFPTKDSDHDQ